MCSRRVPKMYNMTQAPHAQPPRGGEAASGDYGLVLVLPLPVIRLHHARQHLILPNRVEDKKIKERSGKKLKI